MDWDATVGAVLTPSNVSEYRPIETDRESFLAGAHALGLIGRRFTLKPQQLLVADVLDAGNRVTSMLMPRRSSKTTSILAWAIGRALTREDYRIGWTLATTGKAARDIYAKDVVPMLDRVFPPDENAPFRIRRAAGQERIEFANGSVFQVLAPRSDDFRGNAFDVVIVDEAGEAAPDQGEELFAALLPTLDTRLDAQIVVAGTAGAYRRGNLLWDALDDARRGFGGILEYALPDTLTADDIETWEHVAPLIAAVHPGVGTLTSLDSLELNWRKMRPDLFLREYGGIFGDLGATSGIIRAAQWEAALIPGPFPEPPKHFALAIAASPSQQSAAIVAAWREDGEGRLLLLDHREGTRWLAARAAELAARYRVPIQYDNFGVVLVEVEKLQTMRPKPRLEPQNTRDTTVAAAKLVGEIESGATKHFGQDELTSAALVARKRTIGPKAWAFGRPTPGDDIAAIEAAAMALRAYDEMPVREGRLMILRPTG
jgi:hypothetical protein